MANEGGEQAFRSLVETVTKGDPKTKLSPEAITRLTEKLGEIVGYDFSRDFTPESRNERGELVNEEGLPIIDITEPVQSLEVSNFVEPEPLVPLAQISPPTRERLRQRRDRILDTLEQEERQEEEKDRQKEQDRYEELARKRKNIPENEKQRLNSAKELQKKMGKALLRNMAEFKEQTAKGKEEQRIKDGQEEARRKTSTPFKKKNVTFVDVPDVLSPEKEKEEWGDIIPGRIHPMQRPSLLSEKFDLQTMKMNVVERYPSRLPLTKPTAPEKDSDDESEGGDVHRPDSQNHSEEEMESDYELEEEIDFDYASMQRQVQLEYHRKRAIIGKESAALIQSPPEPETEHNEDKLGISKADSAKSAISQYRASRLVSAYGATNSPPMSNFIVPAASAQTLRTAIRTGKLDDDGKLVGGEDDSASETEDNGMQEVLELLKKGEVYNIGPNGEPILVLPKDKQPSSSSTKTAPTSALRLNETKTLAPLTTKAPMSKFKLSRLAAGRTLESPASFSAANAAINHLRRSSPKVATPLPSSSSSTLTPTSSSSAIPPPPFSMIVESPSFPLSTTSEPLPAAPSTSFPIQVVERRTNRPDRPPVIASVVRESTPIQKYNAPSKEGPSNETPKGPRGIE